MTILTRFQSDLEFHWVLDPQAILNIYGLRQGQTWTVKGFYWGESIDDVIVVKAFSYDDLVFKLVNHVIPTLQKIQIDA